MSKVHLVFDLGGTLVTDNQPQLHHIEPEEFVKIGLVMPKGIYDMKTIIDRLFVENFKDCEKQISSDDIIKKSIEEFDIKSSYEDLINLSWMLLGGNSCNYISPLDGVNYLLETLKNSGLEINALSNTAIPLSLLNKIFETYEIKKYFHKIVLSSECGWRKPSMKIMNCLEEEIGYEIGDTIVVIGNDYEKDICPAIQRKYDTILLDDGTKKDIKENLVPTFTAKNLSEVKSIIIDKYS